MILQIVKLRTGLTDEELLRIARERAPRFRALPGLLQKYYVRRGGPGEFAGVYLWDSRASMEAFRESQLARSIPEAYQVVEPPVVEVGEVLFPLRDGVSGKPPLPRG
jgi:heme-degrading monooxygenase HmoA